MTVHVLAGDSTIKEKLINSSPKDTLQVVDFFATWCGPCKVIAPTVAEYSNQHPDIEFYKIDVDEESDFSAECKIRAMPTFVLFKNGQEVGRVVGANPPALFEAIEKQK